MSAKVWWLTMCNNAYKLIYGSGPTNQRISIVPWLGTHVVGQCRLEGIDDICAYSKSVLPF